MTILRAALFLIALGAAGFSEAAPNLKVDYQSFLAQHDMTWDRVPHRWEVAPFSGNGNVGFLFYQAKDDAKNVISIHAGRHDYYDHRLPHEGHELLWIYRGRLPLGRFQLESKGDIIDADLRLNLWNAELTGEIKTTAGSYKIRGLSHSTNDVLYFDIDATSGESVRVTWLPAKPFSSVRRTLDQGGGPKAGGTWQRMREAPYPMPPKPTFGKSNGLEYCTQILLDHRGETTTAWNITGDPAGRQQMLASVHHSFPERNSLATTEDNLRRAQAALTSGTFFTSHQAWWHDYYPQSFLTLNDAEKEAFYWIQMYKLGSAMRNNGPILDLMGPWYHKTFWPMVWGDLNVQLIYWTHLTSNRMSVGESLPNNIDKYAATLVENGPSEWPDSANIATLFPQNLEAKIGKNVPDMLAWVLHNYWLHCQFAGDRERMRDKLFPVLRQTMNTYLNYLRERKLVDSDGTIHIKRSWSPEYPGGRGQDINFTIGLLRWTCQTLLDINEEHQLNDPLASEWRRVLDNLVAFQIDENGLRIGKDIPFEKPHRHYSHLLPFYPLAVITPETPDNKAMLRTTLDHWLSVSIQKDRPNPTIAVTGYTATGAASMYAWLGDSERASHYLDFLINHRNVATTTMYAEGNPVIETPLSFATSVHDMLLQSWGGTIRVFPATPEKWPDAAFHRFRAQGAFLVSAKKQAGSTQFVRIESEQGGRCRVQLDIARPTLQRNGKPLATKHIVRDKQGTYTVDLAPGDTLLFTSAGVEASDCVIEALPVEETQHHLFGYNKNTERLPGHAFYSAK